MTPLFWFQMWLIGGLGGAVWMLQRLPAVALLLEPSPEDEPLKRDYKELLRGSGRRAMTHFNARNALIAGLLSGPVLLVLAIGIEVVLFYLRRILKQPR